MKINLLSQHLTINSGVLHKHNAVLKKVGAVWVIELEPCVSVFRVTVVGCEIQ